MSELNRFGFRQDRWAWLGGGLIFAAVASTRFLMGRIYGETEVVRFIEGIQDPALFFSSALAASSTTALALMLTLLGFTHRLDEGFDDEFFQRVYRVGLYSTFTLCGAVFLMLILIFPLGEFDKVPKSLYPSLYTAIILLVAALAMIVFVTVILLFTTIRNLIQTIRGQVADGSSG